MEDEDQVRKSLAEVDGIVANLIRENNFAAALDVAMRGLEIRRNFFGVGTIDFESARVDVAKMVLSCADTHQVHKQHREAAELLAHVDKLTTHPLPRFPALDRGRLLLRVTMLREMLIARHHQGRHRSALTFGRHLLDLAKNLHLVYAIPSIYLSIASVYSAMKLHPDALAHCYIAYQHTCNILNALEQPEESRYVIAALATEEPDKAMDFQRGYERFEECVELAHGAVPLDAVPQLDLPLPRFNIEVKEDEEKLLTGLQYLLWAATTTKRRDARFPCVKLLSEMEAAATRPSPPPASAQLSNAQKRWGGMLALVFRSIAVEQEHLNQIATALLTYKVGYTTALQCLGEAHPVTLQCKAALTDAEHAAQSKELQKSYLKRKPDSSVSNSTAHRSAATPLPGSRPRVSSPPRPKSQLSGTMPLRNRKERPIWNEWFNSTSPPPSHQQRKHAKPMTAPTMNFTGTLNSTLATLPSTILNPESMLHTSAAVTGSEAGTGPRRHAPPRRLSPVAPSRMKYVPPPSRYHEAQDEDDENVVEPINPADYAYLQQTFGLRHDPAFSRARPKPVQRAHREDVESQALAAEKRLAMALAVEMGVNTDD